MVPVIMGKIEKFEDIESWKLTREITRLVYEVSTKGAFSKDFALCNQIRRASISVLSNIAEGFERGGNKEFLNFLAIAKGSCGEVRCQLYVALDQSYIDSDQFQFISEKLLETSRLISGLMKYLQQSDLRGSKFK
jgi:four helix bundle protein